MSGSRDLLANRGLDPEQVAAQVVAAIREQRFWILPHPEYVDVVRERVGRMAEDGGLPSGIPARSPGD